MKRQRIDHINLKLSTGFSVQLVSLTFLESSNLTHEI